MSDAIKFRDAMSSSTRLLQEDQYQQALTVLDEAIPEAARAGQNIMVCTLCHHAAVIAGFMENLELAKHYYKQSLASDPENSRALYGLATISADQGDHETAKQYAARCYHALTQNDEDNLRKSLMDLLLKNWPEVAEK